VQQQHPRAHIIRAWDQLACTELQVTVPNLQEGSTYYYKVGDPTKPKGVSPVFHFKVLLAQPRTASVSCNKFNLDDFAFKFNE